MKYLDEPPIPIDWITSKLTEYVSKGRYSSSALPIVFTLISDWRNKNRGKEIKNDRKNK